VLVGEILVVELLAVNRLSARAIVPCKIPALHHEVGNDTMKLRVFIPEPVLASTELPEVPARFRAGFREQLEDEPAS
jgi:hypothetical protein